MRQDGLAVVDVVLSDYLPDSRSSRPPQVTEADRHHLLVRHGPGR